MSIYILSFLVFVTLCGLMSVGVVFGGRRLRGSCGGTGSDCACDSQARARRGCEGKGADAEGLASPLVGLPSRPPQP